MIKFLKSIFKKEKPVLETERLLLRRWTDDDAFDLFKYASSEVVGPMCGWNPHKTLSESKHYLRTVFSEPNVFAVVPKTLNHPVGAIAISCGESSNLPIPDDEGEIGYWLGEPFWGQGLMPEATKEMIRYGFEDLGLKTIWCGYFDGNIQSKRVQEKSGFIYDRTEENIWWEQTQEYKTEHITKMTRKDYNKNKNEQT